MYCENYVYYSWIKILLHHWFNLSFSDHNMAQLARSTFLIKRTKPFFITKNNHKWHRTQRKETVYTQGMDQKISTLYEKNLKRGYQTDTDGWYGTNRGTQKNRNQTRLHLGRRTVSDRNNQQRGIQYGPRYHQNDKQIQLFREYYMLKRNTYHSQGDFFWAKQENNETPEEHWKKLAVQKSIRSTKVNSVNFLVKKSMKSTSRIRTK